MCCGVEGEGGSGREREGGREGGSEYRVEKMMLSGWMGAWLVAGLVADDDDNYKCVCCRI